MELKNLKDYFSEKDFEIKEIDKQTLPEPDIIISKVFCCTLENLDAVLIYTDDNGLICDSGIGYYPVANLKDVEEFYLKLTEK